MSARKNKEKEKEKARNENGGTDFAYSQEYPSIFLLHFIGLVWSSQVTSIQVKSSQVFWCCDVTSACKNKEKETEETRNKNGGTRSAYSQEYPSSI